MTTPIWLRLMYRLKETGGFSPSMLNLIDDAGVDISHGHATLKKLHELGLVKLMDGKCDKLGRPVQLVEYNSDNWLITIYGGDL